MKFKWEEIFYESDRHITHRSKVVGGWLVNHIVQSGRGITSSMVFVPDPEHVWEIEKE